MACLRRYLFCLVITAPSLFAAGIEFEQHPVAGVSDQYLPAGDGDGGGQQTAGQVAPNS